MPGWRVKTACLPSLHSFNHPWYRAWNILRWQYCIENLFLFLAWNLLPPSFLKSFMKYFISTIENIFIFCIFHIIIESCTLLRKNICGHLCMSIPIILLKYSLFNFTTTKILSSNVLSCDFRILKLFSVIVKFEINNIMFLLLRIHSLG